MDTMDLFRPLRRAKKAEGVDTPPVMSDAELDARLRAAYANVLDKVVDSRMRPTLIWPRDGSTPITVDPPTVDEHGRPLPGEWESYQQRLWEAKHTAGHCDGSPDLSG